MKSFYALVVEKNSDEQVLTRYKKVTEEFLTDGDVTIQVAYSAVNYKDALASSTKGGVIRHYPMIPGIDLSGIVLNSSNPDFQTGDPVLLTGYGLGVTHPGGFSELAKVPSEWVVPLPKQLSLKQAAFVGTAGFTAALAIESLEKIGLGDDLDTPILITGASGGVGSLAISMLHQLGFKNITALSRKKEQDCFYFESLGASQVLTPEEIQPEKTKALLPQKFAYVIDTVGGQQLEIILPQIAYGGGIALCGNAGGIGFTTTVLPFILRGIHLFGIDSVAVPFLERQRLWERISLALLPETALATATRETDLSGLPEVFTKLLTGKMTGRTLVTINDGDEPLSSNNP